jgi:hypothetical protein
VLLVKLGVHLPAILRGFIFYIQIAPIAVAGFPAGLKLARPLVGFNVHDVRNIVVSYYFACRLPALEAHWLYTYLMTSPFMKA